MTDFDLYDPRSWGFKGVTFGFLPKEQSSADRSVKRTSMKSYFIATVAATSCALFSSSALAVEPAQLVVNWKQAVKVAAFNNVDEGDVPSNYWPKLLKLVKSASHLPDDDYSFDPDTLP